MWDILLQNWLNDFLGHNPRISVHAEVHGPEVLIRRLIEGTLDMAFMFEALQIPELMVEEVCAIDLVMVSSTANITTNQALCENYILVDWGTSFSITHAQHFPDMAPPKLHVQLGRLAHSYLMNCGGSAYLAETMIQEELTARQLYKVKDAPVIKRMAFAAFSPKSEQRELIENTLQTLRNV